MSRTGEWSIGAVLGVLAVTETSLRTAGPVRPQYTLVLCLVALATTVPVAAPRAAPFAVSAASVLSLGVFDRLTVAGLLAQLFVLYRSGAQLLAVPFLWLALARPGVLAVLLASLAPVAAWAGTAWRARAERLAHRADRQALAGTLLEHTARGERARIARELHDVVAHHISMISVQAETARLTTAGLPPLGAQRLTEIGDTARAGLTEMRRLLGVLRSDASTEPDPQPDLRPQPGLRQLTELLDEAREAAGGGTRLILVGAPVPLDPGVELAAYRIVQEALTNARRHAPGAAVDVELHFAADALRVRVRDNGPGPLEVGRGGHGLLGMRERAAAVGGSLRAGRASPAGFLVEATLPAGKP